MPKIRVLVVDDSVVMRRLISEVLQRDSSFEIVGIAPNGRIALQKLTQVNPDVVTMDVEMPEMDGVQALKELRRTHPKLPVIMFSTLTQRGASATLDALAAGATDYVTKPMDVMDLEESIGRLEQELIPRLKIHCSSLQATPAASSGAFSAPLAPPAKLQPAAATFSSASVELLCIGSSTGGPMALEKVFLGIQSALPVPVAIVQHMPPMFTQMLAQRLDQLGTPLRCHEAAEGMVMQPSHAYIAPGGFHLTVSKQAGRFVCHINSAPPENSCRPSVDVLFRSAVGMGVNLLGVVLTGMGQDGLRGCELIHEKRGQVVVQDQPTSVVWGMPGAVANAHLAHAIVPISSVAAEIHKRLKGGRP